MRSTLRGLFAAASLTLGALAGAATDGTYVMDGGAYSINVKFNATGLTVEEPNKQSPYALTAAGHYEYTNPNNGITYGIRVIDDATIEAFKPGSSQPGTILKLSGPTTLSINEDNPEREKYEAIAEKYAELTESDPDNVHVWSACSAAALGFATLTGDDANRMASQSAMLLKTILEDTGTTPCPDAIPASLW